ncbi:MAG TPA: hypothetical protein VNO23_08040 [Candidatus Binatia bacterium]|nr:hypothetical protein [Candidatus Binatia bacterium]
MVRRVPALVLLLYVALDFANPLMPGAVNFDAGSSVEAVRLERAWSSRGLVAATPAVPPPLAVSAALASTPVAHPTRPAPARPTGRLAAPPRSGPTAESPSSPGDDA